MSTRHGGAGRAIVNVSPGAAKSGSPGEYVDYAASKGAIETFTVGLAAVVAEEGIRVKCGPPGGIHTDLNARGGEPARVDRVKTLVAMKRGGQPEEVATAILWLLSDEASYSSGSEVSHHPAPSRSSAAPLKSNSGRTRYAPLRERVQDRRNRLSYLCFQGGSLGPTKTCEFHAYSAELMTVSGGR